MKLFNILVKIVQGYIAVKICLILYLVHYYPKQHKIDEAFWWLSILILDIWLHLIVFKTDILIIKSKDNEV